MINMNMELSTDPALLGVELPSAGMAQSPTAFLPEEDASTCPLLSATPSPPPMDFIHPLTQAVIEVGHHEETSSTDSSGGIQAPGTLFSKHAYQHLGKNGDAILQDNGLKTNGSLSTSKTPTFVNWNWSVIRKCTFWVAMSLVCGCAAMVVAMIVTLPKSCNPTTPWYQGGVFYEIFPASFQDSNGDGLGDLKGLASRADYLKELGITAVRINSIFPSEHYPDHFQSVTTLMDIDEVLGNMNDFSVLVNALHARNISLLLDLPIYPLIQSLDPIDHNATVSEAEPNGTDHNPSSEYLKSHVAARQVRKEDSAVTTAIRHWLSKGVDGFYLKGIEGLINDPNFSDSLREWKTVVGTDRILIISNGVIENLSADIVRQVLSSVDLIDVRIDVFNGTEHLAQQFNGVLNGLLNPELGPWVHWSLGNVETHRMSSQLPANATLALTLMQMILPGTCSLFYGDEIALQEVYDPDSDHADTKHLHHLTVMAWNTSKQFTSRGSLAWLPSGERAVFEHANIITRMINLRTNTPVLYKNAIRKDGEAINNFAVRHSRDDLLVLERWYPRRNSFVSVTNLAPTGVTLDLSAMFYSGDDVLLPTGNADNSVYFQGLYLAPHHTTIIKLDK